MGVVMGWMVPEVSTVDFSKTRDRLSWNVNWSLIFVTGELGEVSQSPKSDVMSSIRIKGGCGFRVNSEGNTMGMQHESLFLQRIMYLSSSKHRDLQYPILFFQHLGWDKPPYHSLQIQRIHVFPGLTMKIQNMVSHRQLSAWSRLNLLGISAW